MHCTGFNFKYLSILYIIYTTNEMSQSCSVNYFIAEKDPILELYLSLCFLHPKCYQLQMPFYQEDEENVAPPPKLDSRQKKILWGHLKARRTESARTLLVNLIKQLEASSKKILWGHLKARRTESAR